MLARQGFERGLQLVDLFFVLDAQGHEQTTLAGVHAEVRRPDVHLHDRAHDVSPVILGPRQPRHRIHNLRDGERRIDAVLRFGGMRGLAVERDGEPAGCRHRGAVDHVDGPRLHPRPVVERIHLIDAFALDDLARHACAVADLFGILEDENDVLVGALLVDLERKPGKGRGMPVVPALVRNAGVARRPGHPDPFIDRQRIEVGTHGHGLARTVADVTRVEISFALVDDLQVARMGMQEIDQASARPDLMVREFGMGVQLVTELGNQFHVVHAHSSIRKRSLATRRLSPAPRLRHRFIECAILCTHAG